MITGKKIIIILLAILILTACSSSATPEQEAAANTPPPTPTDEATPLPPADTPSPPTAPPIPTATSAAETEAEPSPLPPTEEAVAVPEGNPDLEYAQVEFVQATQNSNGLWRFDVTVRHNDQGWENYADAWQVVDLEGNVLGERILMHPHDNEQPFTRSQNNIEIPPETTQVVVRAKDNVDGFGGEVVLVDLTQSEGEKFEVVRQ